jgi:hypothetical protein
LEEEELHTWTTGHLQHGWQTELYTQVDLGGENMVII